MHASGGVMIFVRHGLSFSELFTSPLSSLDPYSAYVEDNISLSDSSSLAFLNVYALPIGSSPTDGRIDSFSPSILPSSRNLFILGDFNCHHALWDSKGTWVISSPSMTLIYLLLSIDPPLTSPFLRLLSPYLAPGRCFRTWVLISYQFLLAVSLRSFAPTSDPFPSIFRKLARMTLPRTLTLTVLLQRNTRLFLFLRLLLSLPP